MAQFRVLQQFLHRVLASEVWTLHSEIVYNLLFDRDDTLDAHALRTSLESGVIWYDYFSVPQGAAAGGEASQLMAAVESIPAYVSLSAHFLVLCPPLAHADTGELCDFASWSGRGWCRMEGQARDLAPLTGPLIVLESATVHYLMPPYEVTRTPVGEGAFSCCRMNHLLRGKPIPCDKHKVARSVGSMVGAKLRALHETARASPNVPSPPPRATNVCMRCVGGDRRAEAAAAEARREATERWRWMLARRSTIFRALPEETLQLVRAPVPAARRSMAAFLDEYGFACAADVNGCAIAAGAAVAAGGDGARSGGGLSPLRFAVVEGDAALVRQLVAAGADVGERLARAVPEFFHLAGLSLLHTAAFFNRVDSGADTAARNANGDPPIHSAICGRALEMARWLVDEAGESLEQRDTFGEKTPLITCGLHRAEEIGLWLIRSGASVNAVNGGGATALHDATLSNAMRLVEALLSAGASVDVQMTPRLPFFKVLFTVMALLRRLGVQDEKVQAFGQTRGCSPLMWCGLWGRPAVAELLLRAGARAALRNANGETASQIARQRGFAELAEQLEAAEAPDASIRMAD